MKQRLASKALGNLKPKEICLGSEGSEVPGGSALRAAGASARGSAEELLIGGRDGGSEGCLMPAFTIPCLGSWRLCLFCCRGSVLLGESCRGAHGVGRCRRVLEGSWPLAELQTANIWLQEAAGGYIYRWLLLQRAGVLGTSDFNNELPGFIARQVLRFPAEHRQV